jgi:hypothetical protein
MGGNIFFFFPSVRKGKAGEKKSVVDGRIRRRRKEKGERGTRTGVN